jgi:hypothetical protein
VVARGVGPVQGGTPKDQQGGRTDARRGRFNASMSKLVIGFRYPLVSASNARCGRPRRRSDPPAVRPPLGMTPAISTTRWIQRASPLRFQLPATRS